MQKTLVKVEHLKIVESSVTRNI